MSRIWIAYNAALPPRVYPDPPPPRSSFLNGQDHAWVTGIRRALSPAEVNQPASDVRGEAWELRSAMWSSGRLIETCTFDTCQLCGDFCGVSSALGMQTPLFPHIDWKEKKKKNHRCSHAAYQMWQTSMESDEKTRGRRDWIALFDLYGFLVNSLTALSARFRSKNRLQFL